MTSGITHPLAQCLHAMTNGVLPDPTQVWNTKALHVACPHMHCTDDSVDACRKLKAT